MTVPPIHTLSISKLSSKSKRSARFPTAMLPTSGSRPIRVAGLREAALMMWAGGRKQSNAGPNVQLSFPVTSIQVLIKAPGDKHGYLIFGQPEEITPTNGGWFIR